MSIVVGIASREGPETNPHLNRCLESLRAFDPGVAFELRTELGADFTRGEKRQRIFTYAAKRQVKYVCILEDDTEIVEHSWLYHLVYPMIVGHAIGIVNPGELRFEQPVPEPQENRLVVEKPTAFGFCMAYNMEWQPRYDPRITYLDDFAMSMQCRAAGFRVAQTALISVRHTKQPFASDDTPPWQQADRARWGDGDRYYDAEMFHKKRVREAHVLIEQYGDMAIDHLPPELLTDLAENVTFRRHAA